MSAHGDVSRETSGLDVPRVDLAAASERFLGHAEAARQRAAAHASILRDDPPAVTELSPLVAKQARVLDDLLPRRYQHAVPALDVTWSWLEQADDGAGLLLLGPTGTGKTWEAYGAVRAWAAAGRREAWPVFGNVATLLDRCRPGGPLTTDDLCSAPLLLLDDLGAFKPSEWTAEVLYRVIDARWSEMLPTIVTTNLGAEDLRAGLGDRLASRVRATMSQVPMTGADQRRRSQP